MRTARGPDGTRYLLLKQSSESSLVRDPTTGEERHLPNADLTVEGDGPLETAALAVPAPVRTLLRAVPSERALGLLLELDRHGSLPVTALMGDYDVCESDMLGLLTNFRAVGLVEPCTVAGEQGYRLTDAGETALDAVRD